ncbi:hypothetical protein J6590_032200 [Homalodisca vitripennis]|nr:hypothetical protein J6590_032200 [Homalodisca vitripennis]
MKKKEELPGYQVSIITPIEEETDGQIEKGSIFKMCRVTCGFGYLVVKSNSKTPISPNICSNNATSSLVEKTLKANFDLFRRSAFVTNAMYQSKGHKTRSGELQEKPCGEQNLVRAECCLRQRTGWFRGKTFTAQFLLQSCKLLRNYKPVASTVACNPHSVKLRYIGSDAVVLPTSHRSRRLGFTRCSKTFTAQILLQSCKLLRNYKPVASTVACNPHSVKFRYIGSDAVVLPTSHRSRRLGFTRSSKTFTAKFLLQSCKLLRNYKPVASTVACNPHSVKFRYIGSDAVVLPTSHRSRRLGFTSFCQEVNVKRVTDRQFPDVYCKTRGDRPWRYTYLPVEPTLNTPKPMCHLNGQFDRSSLTKGGDYWMSKVLASQNIRVCLPLPALTGEANSKLASSSS